jgi:hypothetical protein
MRHFRKHSQLYAPIAAVTLALFVQACTHWTPVAVEPANLPATGQVRATLKTGNRVIVTSPEISGDTLRSAATDGVRWSRARARPGIPLAGISTLEVRKADAAATAGVVVLSVVAVGAITLFALVSSLKFDSGFCAWSCP